MRTLSLIALFAATALGGLQAGVPTKQASWEYPFTTPQAATNPIAHKGRAYVPTNTTLHALDAVTGRGLWTFRYPATDRTDGGYASASDALVVVATFNALYALHAVNGSLAWTFKAPAGTKPQGFDGMRPRFGERGGGLYVTTGYTPLIRLNHRGEVDWVADASTGTAELHATEANGIVYAITKIDGVSYAAAYNARTAAIQWKAPNAWTLLVSEENGIVLLQGATTGTNGQRVGVFTAANLADGSVRYRLEFPGYGHIDDYFTGSTLYTMTAPNTLPYDPTTFYKFDAVKGGPAKWSIPNLDFLFFTSCRKGILNFGPKAIDGYSERDGSLAWRYEGTAVNAGVLVEETDAIVAVLQNKVIALDF